MRRWNYVVREGGGVGVLQRGEGIGVVDRRRDARREA
jgi:hypothetical protein